MSSPGEVVYTNKAHCRDCYRCVRVCPVKAIRLEDGQASVVGARCISCGICIRECPQGAKSYRLDTDRVRELLRERRLTVASIAPSFAGIFAPWEVHVLPGALRRLGFGHVAETAAGAWHVARQTAAWTRAHPGASCVGSACPAVVRYLEGYRPEAAAHLAPVVSPMLAHAKMLRDRLGADIGVVFIGPCVAKKAEADRAAGQPVDAVLTFAELRDWLAAEGVDLRRCEPAAFDDDPIGEARCFALPGGALRTAGEAADLLAPDATAVCGPEEIDAVLDSLAKGNGPCLIEPLFCRQGCVNGPASGAAPPLFARRQAVLDYARTHPGGPAVALISGLDCAFAAEAIDREPPEAEILRVLEQTGKGNPADQLNCGACGYPNCRTAAMAVVRGLAEPEMCLPYMRRLAERRTDRIIETSPNGILVLDDKLHILSINPAFQGFFVCSSAVCGKPISYLLDPHEFESVAAGRLDRFEGIVRHDRYNLVCHQIIYRLPEENQVVGIFVNITNARQNQEKLRALRRQTLEQARDLLEHQQEFARQMAEFLGNSVSRGEVLVDQLVDIAREETGSAPPGGGRGLEWLRHTSTST